MKNYFKKEFAATVGFTPPVDPMHQWINIYAEDKYLSHCQNMQLRTLKPLSPDFPRNILSSSQAPERVLKCVGSLRTCRQRRRGAYTYAKGLWAESQCNRGWGVKISVLVHGPSSFIDASKSFLFADVILHFSSMFFYLWSTASTGVLFCVVLCCVVMYCVVVPSTGIEPRTGS